MIQYMPIIASIAERYFTLVDELQSISQLGYEHRHNNQGGGLLLVIAKISRSVHVGLLAYIGGLMHYR